MYDIRELTNWALLNKLIRANDDWHFLQPCFLKE